MAYIFGGNTGIKSPQELAERRALVRSLMARQLSQSPRDMWGGIHNLVSAISGQVAENELNNVEKEGQANAQNSFAPLIEAVRNKQTPDAGTLTSAVSNPWLNPGQRSVAEDLYRQHQEANQPMTPYQKALLDLNERKLAQSRTAASGNIVNLDSKGNPR